MVLLRPGQLVPAGPSAPSPGPCTYPVPASLCTSASCTSSDPAHLLLHICPMHIPCFVPTCSVPASKGSGPVAGSQRAEVAVAGSCRSRSTLGTAAAPSNTRSPHIAPQPPISPAVAAELPPCVAPAAPLAGGTEAKTGFPGRGTCCRHCCL